MVVNCEIVESLYEDEEAKQVITYGLVFFKKGNNYKPVKVVEDIFANKSKIVALKELINNNDLCAIHIDDVIEDAILSW